ncbi:peptidoglycan DD-metalloendopeptidase family protein [Flavobacterium sp. RSP15]|uniref:peptidoglycan DD-metalloendopeptidase family protein n=1 Tax=Flavobacterium sp. RSP15 TaxID=2497485 RepID=UPI001F223071|nr:peptidoglycan DD-metalloendopeptidase family protein [Flavobacterium sp. RSP15]
MYTLGGQLKSINHPSLAATKDPGGDTNDIFGITLDYYNGDYLRTDRNITTSPTAGADYNGNIKAARWANKSNMMDLSGSTINQKGYLYNYDRNNWLTAATFGNTNASTAAISPDTKYKEAGLTYDANGNIKTLQRTNEAGTALDNLTYNYANTGKNQLNSVTDAVVSNLSTIDIDSQPAGNYVYDAIGQLIQNTSENLYYFYNTQGLVTEVRLGSTTPIVKFFYNERGQRIKKEGYQTNGSGVLQNTTYYCLDLSGNTMAVYNMPSGGAIAQTDLPIYGLSRLGVYNKASNASTYEITDHLGNVRAVITKTGTIQSYADYYPFGEQLPMRTSLNNYRYAFQGQELDGETNMEAFQLRLWDGRIGRWLSPDPYGEFDSPYLGMGNNPISLIDPDGGQTIDPPVKGGKLKEVIIQGRPKSSNFKMDWSSAWRRSSEFNFKAPTINSSLNGNPLSKMEILPTAAGYKGGTWGYTRNSGKKFHDGIDLRASVGTPVYAMRDGIVTKSISTQIQGIDDYKDNIGDRNGAGNRVAILSKGGLTVSYWHLSAVHVKVHAKISQGDIIGLSGSTGNANRPGSSGPHLHLNIKINGTSVNPMLYTNF